MPYSVTSWFINEAMQQRPNVVRKLTLSNGASDYSERVSRWPSISQQWDDFRPISATISLENGDQLFNFFKNTKLEMRNIARLELGFTHPDSGDELINVFEGPIDRISFRTSRVDITVTDKFKQLSDRVVGDTTSPVVMSGAALLPSDVAWWLVTSYGGMSNIASTTNPDVDYQSWLDWAAVWSGDNVLIGARWEGQSVTEALRKISRHTQSAIFRRENKMAFARFTTINTETTSLGADIILNLNLRFDDADMVNRQHVLADYRAESDYWTISTLDVRTPSVNSWGERNRIDKDESFWYVNSISALNLAQRLTTIAGEPFERIEIETPLVPIRHHIGELLNVNDPQLSIARGLRIMQQTINMQTGRLQFNVDASQVQTPFILDVSALDSNDLLL